MKRTRLLLLVGAISLGSNLTHASEVEELTKAEAEQSARLGALETRRRKLTRQTKEKTKAFHALKQNMGGGLYAWEENSPVADKRQRLERLLQLSIREDLKEAELLDIQLQDLRAELELLRARRQEAEGLPTDIPVSVVAATPAAVKPPTIATTESFRCLDLPVRAATGASLDLLQDFGAKRDSETGIAWRSLGWWLSKTSSEVRACAPGTVAYVGRVQGRGRVVVIEHGGGGVTLYANLNDDPDLALHKGDAVKLGQALGTTRERMYFEARRNGVAVDPREVLPPALLAAEMPPRGLESQVLNAAAPAAAPTAGAR